MSHHVSSNLFLHFVIKKGARDECPSNDVEAMKFCSFRGHEQLGYGTIRPPNEEEEWGDKVFKSTAEHGYDYAKYLKTNSFSTEGLDFIAKYNNYESEWETEKAAFDNDASIADTRFVNLVLYATWRERRCFHLDPIEGGHRKVGII